MKVLIVYDSLYGNTEKIARAIGGAFTTSDEVEMVRSSEANTSQLESIDLLIVGSPTQGGKATKSVQEYLDKVPAGALKNIRVASFDTRLKTVLVKLFGYAAGRIANSLKEKGGQSATPPQGFLVKGSKGPLEEGELEKASAWAKTLSSR